MQFEILSDDYRVLVGQVPQDLSHSHFSGLTVKNAIVDQFRSRQGRRPDVDIVNPDLPVVIYLHRGEAILYRVWSGDSSMHKRGYRETVHRYFLMSSAADVDSLKSCPP